MTEQETCKWWNDDGIWTSKCGVAFEFTVDGPKENGFKFCQECGKPIEIVEMEDKE